MPPPMIGLSTTYYATKKLGIYEAAKAVAEQGFNVIELGAAFKFEPDIWETVKRIKHDFPDLHYTVHGLFPPQREHFWFNASLGLTKQNKKVINEMFRAAQITEAMVVGIHPGFSAEVGWGENRAGLNLPIVKKPIAKEKGIANTKEVIEYALQLAGNSGAELAVENISPEAVEPLIYTKDDFELFFSQYPELHFLLDIGHALFEKRLDEFLQFADRIVEVHVHFSNPRPLTQRDQHLPLPANFDFRKLLCIKQLDKIPLVFEHGNNVTEEQIAAERRMLEKFISENY